MNYFLGVDGGGTTTTVAVADENGNILAKCKGKTINYCSVGLEKARENFKAVLDEAERITGVNAYKSAFIGSSALTEAADDETTERFCGGILNAEKIFMHSDVYAALCAVGDEVPKCVVISGTGSVAAALDCSGNYFTAGGWGHIMGDEGSAYGIATAALRRCVYLWDSGIDSPFLKKCCEFFGIESFAKIEGAVYGENTTKDVIASLATVVSELAAAGDVDALEILKDESRKLFQTAEILFGRTGGCEKISLYGGVFKNVPLFREKFEALVKQKYPNIKIGFLEITPEDGAVKAALKL